MAVFKGFIFRNTCKFIALVLLVSSSTPTLTLAVGGVYDEQFYSNNDIIYYNPSAVDCQTGSNSEVTAVDVSSDNAETLLKYFTGKGLSLAAAAGIVGNLNAESGLNPAIKQGGKIADDTYNPVNGTVGFGLAQWTSSGRQQNLVNFAKSKSAKITDLTMQLDFLWKELNESYKKVIPRLNEIKDDPVAAAIIFHGMTPNIEREGASMNFKVREVAPPTPGFESSADSSDKIVKNRGGFALAVYKKFSGKISDGAGAAVDTPEPTTTGSGSGCNEKPTTNSTSTGSIGVGKGKFTDSGNVKGSENVLHNSTLANKEFGTSLVGDGICAAIVSRVWQGKDIGYASTTPANNGEADDLWDKAGSKFGHADRNPKVGSILIYRSSKQSAGHVVIYLGGNKVLNDGHIEDAEIPEKAWGLQYLGWIDPNDVGWQATKTNNIRAALASKL